MTDFGKNFFQSPLVVAFIFSIIIILMVKGLAHSAGDSKPEIVKFDITNQNGYIYIDAQLKRAFNEGISEAIASGIPTSFKFYLEIVKPGLFFFNKKIAYRLIQHSVVYDTLKKEYIITIDHGTSTQVKVTESEEEMRKWMTNIDSFRFISCQEIQGIDQYRIKLKAEMKTINMPFPLNYLLSFVSFWDFDTPWVSSSIPGCDQ